MAQRLTNCGLGTLEALLKKIRIDDRRQVWVFGNNLLCIEAGKRGIVLVNTLDCHLVC